MQENTPPTFQIIRSRSISDSPDSAAIGSNVFVIEESLGYLMNYAAKLFARMHAHCLEQHGVTLGQWAVLLFLWVEDGVSQTELSRHVAIDDATMVRTLDRMERDGLVQRQRSTHDRRQINVFLTEKGRMLRDPLIPCAVAVNSAATHALTEVEQNQLHTLLHRMITSLEQTLMMENERSS